MPIVDTIDLKNEGASTEDDHSEDTQETTEEEKDEQDETVESDKETDEDTETESEDIETLPKWAQDRLKKAETDKENYKKGMLKYKDMSLTKKEDKEETEDDSDDDSTAQLVKSEVRKALEATNEKTAIAQFAKDHPEVTDKKIWNSIIENYTPKNGKDSKDDIIKDLDRALLLTRYESGDIDKMIAESETKGKKRGAAEALVADLHSLSQTTSKTAKDKPALSSGALKLAQKMRVDVKKLAKEDDSNTAVINL